MSTRGRYWGNAALLGVAAAFALLVYGTPADATSRARSFYQQADRDTAGFIWDDTQTLKTTTATTIPGKIALCLDSLQVDLGVKGAAPDSASATATALGYLNWISEHITTATVTVLQDSVTAGAPSVTAARVGTILTSTGTTIPGLLALSIDSLQVQLGVLGAAPDSAEATATVLGYLNWISENIASASVTTLQDSVTAAKPSLTAARVLTITGQAITLQDSVTALVPSTLASKVTAIKASTDNLPASPARQDSLLAAAVQVRLANTTAIAINAKTTNLPTAPAREDSVEAAATQVRQAITATTAINAKTTNLPASPAVQDSVVAAATQTRQALTAALAIKTATDKLAGTTGSGTFSYLDAGGEQTAITIPITSATEIRTIWLDMTTLVQSNTVRVKYRIDGTNYRTFASTLWTTALDDGLPVYGPIAVGDTVLVTMTEAADEGAARAIPYRYFIEAK